MLLKPKNLEDLTVQLHALPKEKRNVIVLVGRHLNEGTLNLAVRHHKDWEKKGAVAVRIPPQWTPHGFYHNVLKAIRKGLLGLSFFRPSPEDSKGITHLSEKGFNVPIVNFHGTPKPGYGGYVVYEVHPNKSRIVLPDKWVMFKPGKKMLETLPNARFVHDSYGAHPHEILVEYHYEPSSDTSRQKYAKKVNDAIHHNSNVFVEPSPQTSIDYLAHAGISRDALETFSEKHHGRFLELLAGLSKKGLAQDVEVE